MSYYNNNYSYPDMFLWQDETWKDRVNKVAPLFCKLKELMEEDRRTNPPLDHFADRHDEVRDRVNHSAYFPDVVEAWKQKGMVFSDYGMMGEQMAPVAVDQHLLADPPVLYIPVCAERDDPHGAMNHLVDNTDALELAAKENVLVQFVDCEQGCGGALMEQGVETEGNFRISYDPVYLDISVLLHHGLTLADVPGLDAASFPQPVVVAGRPAVDISDKWQVNVGHQYTIGQIYLKTVPEWDRDRHIRTLGAKRQAEGMRLEYAYRDPHDPNMAAFWAERGLKYEDHYREREWYVTLVPESVYDEPACRLPLLIVLKEPRKSCPGMMQTAFQFYYDFIEICARGEYMMLFFALETPWDNNEVLPGVLDEVLEHYPVDPSRVYITGQSHNGYYALEYYRTHPKQIAAAATLSDPAGLQVGARIDYYQSHADEIIKSFQAYDYPLIDINGELENSYRNPGRSPEKIAEDTEYFKNRLKAWKIPARTDEEISGALMSTDYVTRKNGIPADRTEVRYTMGIEAYVSDFLNTEGRSLYRYVSLENVPHMIMPQMAELSWEFMRRFARDTLTGESIELY